MQKGWGEEQTEIYFLLILWVWEKNFTFLNPSIPRLQNQNVSIHLPHQEVVTFLSLSPLCMLKMLDDPKAAYDPGTFCC